MDNSSNFSMRKDSNHSVALIAATKWVLPLCALVMSSLTGVFVPGAALAQATQPSAYSTATRYDAVGRVTGTIAPDPDGSGPRGYLAIRTTYDDRGLPITQESGELATWQSDSVAPDDWSGFTVVVTAHTAYDTMGRKTREWSVGSGSAAIQTMTQYSYDAVGRLECTAVRMKPSKFNNLPNGACTDSDTNASPPDRITKTIYDAADQVKQVRKAVGTPLEQAYATYDYTPNGQQKYVIDANGNKAEMIYDGHDRRARWSFPSKTKPTSYNDATVASALTSAGAVSATDYEAYTYDDNGNILTKRKRDGQVIGFTYDRLNRVSKKDIPGGTAQDVHYGYDLRGLQVYTRFGNASGNGIETVYDGFGRISETTNKMFAMPRSLSYEYDQNGNRTKITHPGSNGQANGAFFTYEYDKLDRLTAVREQGSTVLLTQSYDNRGHRAATARTNATTSYDYDLIGRLASLNTNVSGTAEDNLFSFAYSPASQMKSLGISNKLYEHTAHYNIDRQYTTNGLNQYTTTSTGASFTYDANGNLTGDGDTTYAYDVENRLITARGKKEANLIYDPMGRLFETNANSNLSQTTTQFLYDGDALVAEYDDAGNMLHRYVHGSGVDEPMVWYIGATVGAATRSHLHANWQGSITAVTDANGDTQWVNGYDPYGIPNWKNAGRFQYTGQIEIPELEMYHYKARIYSPTMGRFLQTDPIGYEDQVNLYAYVGNDPINGIDPTGMCETQTGSRICRNEGTTLVKSVTIPMRDENGNSNSSMAVQTTEDYVAESIDRTEESDFTREHGVTLSVDEKAQTYVVSLFQGAKKSLFGGGSLNIVPTNRKLLYSSHTHTGVGVQGEGSPFITIRNWTRGRSSVKTGPSSTGKNNDLTSAANWRRSNNPDARFGVYYQVVAPDGKLQWRYSGY